MKKKSLLLLFIFTLHGFMLGETEAGNKSHENDGLGPPVRIGYFHGVRAQLILKASGSGFFNDENVDVRIYTKNLLDDEFYELPRTNKGIKRLRKRSRRDGKKGPNEQQTTLHWGKVSGSAIADLIENGELDGGTVGETSFLQKISEGAPLVAVALLGHEREPAKAITLRKGVAITQKSDWLGKVLASRRSGPGDFIFLMEFLETEGFDRNNINVINAMEQKDKKEYIVKNRLADKINIVPQVDEVNIRKWFIDGTVDGSLLHVNLIYKQEEKLGFSVYRAMDWMKPSISQVLLVFHRDYIRRYPGNVQKVINGTMKRILYEQIHQGTEKDYKWLKGLDVGTLEGMTMPVYTYPPLVQSELLDEMQKLMIKYGNVKEQFNVGDFIDNRFVEKAFAEIKNIHDRSFDSRSSSP